MNLAHPTLVNPLVNAIDLQCLDPVTIKWESTTTTQMKGLIIIKKRAIQDPMLLEWI